MVQILIPAAIVASLLFLGVVFFALMFSSALTAVLFVVVFGGIFLLALASSKPAPPESLSEKP